MKKQIKNTLKNKIYWVASFIMLFVNIFILKEALIFCIIAYLCVWVFWIVFDIIFVKATKQNEQKVELK